MILTKDDIVNTLVLGSKAVKLFLGLLGGSLGVKQLLLFLVHQNFEAILVLLQGLSLQFNSRIARLLRLCHDFHRLLEPLDLRHHLIQLYNINSEG